MPRFVRAFACEWGCGRKVTTKRKDMAYHEGICRLNPASKCCPTCDHNDFEAEEWDVGVLGGWFCIEDKLPEGKTMASSCKFWKPKGAPDA